MKINVSVLGDFNEDPDRPGTRDRYQAVYEARSEGRARAMLAEDRATLAPAGFHTYRVHWSAHVGLFGKGRLTAIFDLN